jgi:hypothetical protein
MFPAGSPRTFRVSLIDESALGSKHRDPNLEDPSPGKGSVFTARTSVSSYQHHNDDDDQDKYNRPSAYVHGLSPSLGECRVSQSRLAH